MRHTRRFADLVILERLEREKAWYGQLLDMAPDANVILGADKRIALVNVQAETLFGYTREELIGQPLELLIPDRFRPAHAGHMARYFSEPRVRPMGSALQLFGRRKDGGEIPIEVSLSPQPGDHGMTVSASIRDVTERRLLENAAREAHRTAEAASAAKSEFLSSMSHELRTPLNAILGFAQLLERDKREPLSPRHKERVEQILKGGEHLLRLINDILDLSRIESGSVSLDLEGVEVRDVLAEVRDTLEPIAARQMIDVTIELPDDLPRVHADRTRFAQILMNFGSNAIKYNRRNGRVRFEVTTEGTSHVRVNVIDTGYGIPVELQDRLFQPFQRAGQESGPIEGTGIGLVITKRLAELMGGGVGFRSAPGEGSTFWVDLGIYEASASSTRAPARREAARSSVDAGHHLVLYVEDNAANVAFMRDLVSSFDGIELLAVPNAELGVELARARRPKIVLMDINLPGMSGLDALNALRSQPETAGIPVIALTAAVSERDKQRGIDAGFYRYLTKPVNVDEFITVLDGLLRAHP